MDKQTFRGYVTVLHLIAVGVAVGAVAIKAGPLGVGVAAFVGLFMDRLMFITLWPLGISDALCICGHALSCHANHGGKMVCRSDGCICGPGCGLIGGRRE